MCAQIICQKLLSHAELCALEKKYITSTAILLTAELISLSRKESRLREYDIYFCTSLFEALALLSFSPYVCFIMLFYIMFVLSAVR